MALLLGIDTGGTYTDAVLYDESAGVVAKAKALTTKHDLSIGVAGAIDAVLSDRGAEVALVSLSTTLATNALVESHGNPVGLILIGYPAKALERAGLGEALRGDPVAFVAGGHGPEGLPQTPLDLSALTTAVQTQEPQVQSFAVAGFFAVRNPEHELAARDLIRSLTGKPVTCAHQLSSALDAPRRALTAVLNARLIPLIQQLVESVQSLMKARGLSCPITVVKGDGSLISDEVALVSPVETILSGPAASVVGAKALLGDRADGADLFVSDIGGTTTDIAVLRAGHPVLSREGATVGGFRTMVEAVAVQTLGLGGDSEVVAETGRLQVGPRRAQPLALTVRQHPDTLAVLQSQLGSKEPTPADGRFALRLRRLPENANLKPAEARLWEALAAGPQPLSTLAPDYLTGRALQRLFDRGLAIVSAFTPSDAAHVLGKLDAWSREGAVVAARLLARQLGHTHATAAAEAVLDRVAALSAEALVGSALIEEGGPLPLAEGLGRYLLNRGLGASERQASALLRCRLELDRPVVGIGAPASAYYPEVAKRLGTRLLLPDHAEVCNAVGAVASGIVQRVRLSISMPEEGRYRAHLPDGIADFLDLEEAARTAMAAARAQAEGLARAAGAGEIRLEVTRDDRVVSGGGGLRTFIESVIVATAAGRPRIAHQAALKGHGEGGTRSVR